jgi:hypothetical protein
MGATPWRGAPWRGANWFNAVPARGWLEAAAEKKIQTVRLAPDKWKGAGRDFLVGDCDGYKSLPAGDLKELVKWLDQAQELGIRIILTMLSLPGSRWRQNNGMKDDLRIWREPAAMAQAARFWADLARELRDHPALFGVDPLNEPHPERAGQGGRLGEFHGRMVEAIRGAGYRRKVVIEGGDYASAAGLARVDPVRDEETLYSFHFYDPYEYTTKRLNRGRGYPGRAVLAQALAPVIEWQRKHGLSAGRIYCGEFGCSRSVPGAAQYLTDLVDLIEEQGWPWTFYAFREDTWKEMDYEWGTPSLFSILAKRLVG